jgi:hypothetical protein
MEEIRWTALPARNRRKRILFLLTIFTIVYLVYTLFGIYWSIFSLLVLLGALAQFYTPTTYILKDTHIEIKRPLYTIKREWRTLKRVVPDKRGVLLSPFSKPSRLDAFRGLYLLLDGVDDREKVISFLKEKVERR